MTARDGFRGWVQIAEGSRGDDGRPGQRYAVRRAVVERRGDRFRLQLHAESGRNQGGGCLEAQYSADREWRADSLDDLLDECLRSDLDREHEGAIREAVYAAEDTLAAEGPAETDFVHESSRLALIEVYLRGALHEYAKAVRSPRHGYADEDGDAS